MKSRSEIIAQRKAEAAAAKSKPSADKKKGGTVYCEDCDETLPIEGLNRREDGKYECSGCAMPLEVGARAHQLASQGGTIRTEPLDKAIEDKKAKGDNAARTGSYCGECGAEWPMLDGKRVINCGHMRAIRVDDPRKATNMKGATASGAPNPPAGPPTVHALPSNVTVAVDGNSIRMAWGKAIFPVGEMIGISKFSNMEIGPFSLTEAYDVSRHSEIVTRMFANLQKMADTAFDLQLVWFKEKLGLIK